MNAIQISNVTINQVNNLYSLTDLHKASGGESKHQPALWLRNAQTQELIAEIEAQGLQAVQTSQGGKGRGTYVCQELVVSYGMWISAKFALQVIRAFLGKSERSEITPAQKQQIQAAVSARVHRTGETWQDVYRKLHAFCKVGSYAEIQQSQFDSAMQFLASIDGAPDIFGQQEKAESGLSISPEQLINIAYLLNHFVRLQAFAKKYLPAFRNLGIDPKGEVFSLVTDTETTVLRVAQYIAEQKEFINARNCTKWNRDRLEVLCADF